MRARYHRKAREELARAAEWYEERRPGLGADLLAEVKRALGILVSFPFSSPLWPDLAVHLEVRRCVLRRFPYSIAYLVHLDTLVILAVAHEHREPSYWLDRLDVVK